MKIPLFLERNSYRRRRLVDAIKFLPMVGAGAWVIPTLWPKGVISQSSALLFVFLVWLGLIVAAAVLSRILANSAGAETDTEPGETASDGTPGAS